MFLSQVLCTNEAERQSSASVELPHPMYTDSCGPFTNYKSPQVNLHLHLNLSDMPSKLVFLPMANPMACAFSSTVSWASKLLNWEMRYCLTWSQMASTDILLQTHTCTHVRTPVILV